jgi:hypothetical protein
VVVVLCMCVAGLSAVGAQVRCVDAAREAARLAARGDDGELVMARVTSRPPILLGVTIAAQAVAAAEPGVR